MLVYVAFAAQSDRVPLNMTFVIGHLLNRDVKLVLDVLFMLVFMLMLTFGRVILSNPKHMANAPYPMLEVFLGNSISLIALLNVNALSYMSNGYSPSVNVNLETMLVSWTKAKDD